MQFAAYVETPVKSYHCSIRLTYLSSEVRVAACSLL